MRRLSLAAACALALAIPASAAAAGDPLRSEQWGLSMVESDAAHATATGSGALVAIIDTGVLASHPDLQGGRVLQGHDFVSEDATPQDGDGHGTHVLGIVGATEGNGIGVGSVAPGARLLPVRVLGDDGSGTVEDVVQGIDYAVAQGADVINLSLGGDVPLVGSDASFDAAVGRALDAGRVVVAAAGNNGVPMCEQPSGAGRLLCVGAVDKRRNHSGFSNFGSGLGLVGPGGSGLPVTGEDILSTYNDGAYAEIAGTSQATPHVSGVAALLVGKGLHGQQVVNRILSTATDVGSAGPDSVYGAGIVDARRAVAGLSGPGGGSGTRGLGSAARISMRRRNRIRTVLRRGVRVRCRAAGAGRCRVTVTKSGKRLGSASKPLRIGRTTLVVTRLGRAGRARLRRALRRRHRIALRVRITLPGVRPQLRRLTLLP